MTTKKKTTEEVKQEVVLPKVTALLAGRTIGVDKAFTIHLQKAFANEQHDLKTWAKIFKESNLIEEVSDFLR